MIDLNELRRLVQAATPGPWEVAYTDQNGQAVVKGEHIEIATCWHHCVGSIEKEMYANAALIAAANPAAISDLLDRLEAAEKERDNLRAKIEHMEGALESLLIRCDDSDSAMYGTLSTSFVRDIVRIARGAKGEEK